MSRTRHDHDARTVDDVLRDAAHDHPDHVAVVDGATRVTVGELDRAASGFAATLVAEHAVQPGDVIVLALRSSADFLAAYLGAMRAGAITSAINLRLGPHEQQHVVARSAPRVTVTEDDHSPPGPTGAVVRRRELAAAFARAHLPTDRLPALEPETPVAIVWTSGTTGRPKGAVYDHRALREISVGMGELTEPGDRRLSVTPFAHVGVMTRVWDELANATTLVLTGDPWSATEHLRCLTDERITVAAGVPTQWSWALDHPDAARIDTSHLRIASIGGATVPPALVRRIRATLRCPVVVRYTSTESGLLTGTHVDDPPDVVASTVGRPSPVVELRLVDPRTGRPVDPGAVGEIRCRSRAMFRGYWHDDDATRDAFDADGFLRTGDLGVLGDDGNLRIVGRLKEMYIRGGDNVYPAEVEAVLAEHPAIARAAVVGVPDDELGERGVAFVVGAAAGGGRSADLTEDAVREWCRSRLAGYKAPDRVVVVDELPVTSMMKVDKQALAARAAAATEDA